MGDRLRVQGVGFVNGHDFVVIVENLPADLPVLEAEIAVLEIYLGNIVDEIVDEIERESVATQRLAQRRIGYQEEEDGAKDRRHEHRR